MGGLATKDSGPTVLVSFPLREGASGNREVPLADLTDATPLSSAEAKEMTDLARHLTAQRVHDRKGKQARLDTLRHRAIYAPLLATKLKQLAQRSRDEGEQGAAGIRRYA